MNERWLLIASRPSAPHTGDVWSDAVTLQRRGHHVVVLATDDACTEAVLDLPAVRAAADEGVQILIDVVAAGRRHLADRLAARRSADDGTIARLLLEAGTRVVWR